MESMETVTLNSKMLNEKLTFYLNESELVEKTDPIRNGIAQITFTKNESISKGSGFLIGKL